MSRRGLRWLAAAALLTGTARATHAQSRLSIDRARRDSVVVSSGNTATMVFRTRNAGADSARATTWTEVPDGWTSLLPDHEVVLEPRASDTWLVSVSVPVTAVAGTY